MNKLINYYFNNTNSMIIKNLILERMFYVDNDFNYLVKLLQEITRF